MTDDEEGRGYGKPPRANRFQSGVSGNPRGRPKGSMGLRSEVNSVLGERVEIEINGRTRRVGKRRLIIMALAQKAAKGDVRAAEKLLNLIVQMEGFDDPRTDRTALNETEELIPAQFLGAESPPANEAARGIVPRDDECDEDAEDTPASGNDDDCHRGDR